MLLGWEVVTHTHAIETNDEAEIELNVTSPPESLYRSEIIKNSNSRVYRRRVSPPKLYTTIVVVGWLVSDMAMCPNQTLWPQTLIIVAPANSSCAFVDYGFRSPAITRSMMI